MNKTRLTLTSWIIGFCMVVALVAFGTITAQMQPSLAKRDISPVQGAQRTVRRSPGAPHATVSTVTVNTLDDLDNGACTPVHCSLREAVKYAPAGSDVVFSVTGTIVTGSEIPFNQSLNIVGPGVNSISVSGNNNHRVFSIATGNTVSISDLTITNGRTSSAPGANVLNTGSLTISRSKISSGFASFHNGGGVYNQGPSLTINDSVISFNSADGGGGGVVTISDTTTINRCTFNDNNTGAGFGGAPGGGVYANGSSSIILNVNNCTFFNNHAWQGGGVASFAGTTNLNGVTISGNSATFAGNAGGIRNGATLTINNSIVAGNTQGDVTTFGGTISGDYNLVQDSSFLSAHTINGQDPLLGPLQDNGGLTPTMALASNSPALDQGKSFGLITDQRSFVRPADDPSIANAAGGDGSDIGAYERAAPCAVFSTVYVDDDWAGTLIGTDPDGPGPATNFGCDSFATIQEGINGVAAGGTVNVAAGVYVEIGQIVISKDLSIVGANNVTTIVRPAQDTGTSGDTKGWFLVQSGKTFHLSNVKLDGSGRKTYQAIRYNGSGTVNNVKFANIQYEVSGPTYNGGGVRIGAGNVDVTNCTFDNMGRYGVLAEGGSGTLSGNTYTGKGAGDWLDYGFDIEFGASVTISNNQILHNRGVASSDGSDSAGISVWDDPGTQATITGNTITDDTTGVALAIATGSSDPVVAIQAGNIISGGGVGVGIQNAGATGAPTLTITGSTITGNTTGLSVLAGMSNANVNVHFNRMTGNTSGVNNAGTNSLNGENNWWGCNAGPGNAGCDGVTGTVDFNPWMVLLASATPNSIAPGGMSNVAADMTHNSDNVVPLGTLPKAPVGTLPNIPDSYSATNGTMNPTTGTIIAGAASSTFTSTNSSNAVATVTVDNQQVNVPITVTEPAFTIDDVTHFEGDTGTTAFTFTITKTGATAFNSSVDYATVNGTATAPSDFTAIPTTNFVFLPADTIKQVTVLVNGDTMIEPTEAFTVHLSNASGATIADADGTGTITNDDSCAVFTTVYVDDNWVGTTPGTDPDGGGPATSFGCDSFATIQDGVNGVAPGGTVNVRAGTYAEAVLINKPLTLRGARAGQNAATRFATFVTGANGPKANPALESIITAAATDPNNGPNDTLHVMASNVTIDGFVVDGNNPSLVQTGAVVVGGINTDSRRAIQTEDAAGNLFSANSVLIRNNIIQNFAQRGVEVSNPSDTSPATSGSVITANLIRNFGWDGILIAFNAYSDVTLNTIDMPVGSEAGIWLQDFPSNGGSPKTLDWSHNTVTVCQDAIGGIWANLFYATDATLNIHDNLVNAGAGVTGVGAFEHFGIYLSTLQGGTTAHLTNNTIGASGGVLARGISLWNLPTTTTTTLDGGTVGNSLKGVSLHDNDPNFGLAGANSAVDMNGVSISGTDIGILVDATGSTGDTVAMQISGNTSVSFCTTGISVVGTNASANIHDNIASIHDNTTGIDVSGGFTITGNNLFANATGLRFSTGASGTAHFNRIISTTTAVDNPNNLTPNLENNWWGCNAGPGNTGCGAVNGTGADFNPWIVLGVSASPNPIAPGGTSTVTADMTHNSDALVPLGGTVPPMAVAFSATQGTMAPPTGTITAGQATSLFTSTSLLSGTGCATVDNQLICTAITVTEPAFTIDDVTHFEGDTGTTAFTFTITKNGATAFNSSVDYATVNGTATAPSDFTAIPTTNFVFLPADTIKQVTVLVNGDTMIEPTEAFTVHLSNASGATIADADGTGTITNDDSCAVFTTVYVDDNWVGTTPGTDPDGPGPATIFGCDSFATIQDGVNGVAPGGTVIVRAGTYAENVLVNKALTILGAKAGQNADTRFAAFVTGANGPKADPAVESILTAAVNDPFDDTAGVMLAVLADNVTIDGLVVDGNNPALGASARVINGVNIHQSFGVTNFNSDFSVIRDLNNLQVKNNIVQNISSEPVSMYNSDNGVSSGIVIDGNVIRNYRSQGIVLFDNAFADITNNTIDNNGVRTGPGDPVQGIQAVNFHANGSMTWSGNKITVGQDNFGIEVNLFTGPTAVLNISGNTVNAASGVTGTDDFTWGIYLLSVTNGATVHVTNNTVGGAGGVFGRGINLWNLPTSNTVGVTGGTVGNSAVGINLDNIDPFFGGGDDTTVNIGGVSISGGDSGIRVRAAILPGGTLRHNPAPNTVTGGDSGIRAGAGKLPVAPLSPPNVVTGSVTAVMTTTNITGPGTKALEVSGKASATLTSSTITAFTNGISIQDSAGDPLTVSAHFNRIISTTTAIDNPNNQTVNLENNWWGCNAGPGNAGCGAVTGTGADFNPWIVLLASATPNSIGPGGTSNVAADMTHNSDNVVPAGTLPKVPAGTLPNIPDSYSATNGTMNPTTGTIIAGAASSTFTSTNSSNAVATVTVDNQQVNVPITVTEPAFTIDDVTHFEGNGGPGTTAYVFTVTKTGATALSSSVNFTTVDGSATQPSDYTLNSGTLNFGPTETTMQITVLVNGDTTFEPDEAFTVHLSNATGATIADADGTGTITNDDTAPSFTIDDVTHFEGDTGTTAFTFTITKTGATSFNSSVDYATVNGTATAPSDFTAIPTTNFVFLPAETTKLVTVLVNGDTMIEPDETFTVHLSNASGATIADADGLGTITNDDTCAVFTTVYVDDDWAGTVPGTDPDGPGPATNFGCDSFATIQGGVNGVAAGGTVNVAAGVYVEIGQIVISKDLTIVGANNVTTIVRPAQDTGTSGDTKGWFLVQSGKTFHLSNVKLDGSGRKTYQAIRYNGSGTVNNVKFANIQYEVSGPTYNGGGVRIGTGNVDVTNCTFDNMGRYGVLAENAGSGTFSGNTYTGKGAGDWLDYGFDIEFGASVTISNNQILHNRGVASSDGSESAGISVWDDPGTQATITGNTITDDTTGVALAIASGSSDPVVAIQAGNIISGGGVGVGIQNAGATGAPTLTITGSTITGNTTGLSVLAGMSNANVNVHFNRMTGNTSGVNNAGTNSLNGENNWWGCNAGPGNAGCDGVTGTVDFNPWMVLLASATPNSIAPGGMSNVAADMTHNSDNVVPLGTLPKTPVGTLPNIPDSYSATNGTMNPTTGTIIAGAASSLFTSTNSSNAVATVTVDNQQVNVPIAVNAPTFTIDDVTHFEGNTGTTAYVFTVTKTGATALSSSVNFTTVDGSATQPSDYTLNSGTLNFGPTETTMQITVLVNGDTTVEPDETFTVHLSGAVGATIADADGLGTITNDDNCSYSLSSNSQNFGAAGGMNSVNVIAGTGCAWTAVSNDAFITIDSGTPGSGNGTVGYTVAANTGLARMGTMTIAGKTFTVTQDSGCTFTLNKDHQSFAGNGGTGTVNITASDAGCAWTASTTSLFITITSGGSGSGNGAVDYTVAINAGTTIRSDTITIAGHTFTVYQGTNFLDVPPTDPFYNDIGKLAARGVTLGCTADHTLYCPNDPVTREQMAAFILRAKGEFSPPTPGSQRFNDVPPTNVFYNFIDRLAVLQITLGCTPDHLQYCPADPVLREQMSAFLLRGLGEFNPPIPGSQRFTDVPPSNVFYNFIDRMAVLNITLGCTPDHLMYCPSDPVTRAQMAAFLVRAFNL